MNKTQIAYRLTPKKIWDRRTSIVTKTKELQFLAEDLFDISMSCIGISFKILPVFIGGQFRGEVYENGDKRHLETSADIFYTITSLIDKKLFQHTLTQTVAHEVAHAVMFRSNGIYGIGDHGEEWREIFKSLGGTDENFFEGGCFYEA